VSCSRPLAADAVAVTAPSGMASVANNPKGKKGVWQAIGEIEKDWLRLARYQL
jgi:DNA polymerase III psi subunit